MSSSSSPPYYERAVVEAREKNPPARTEPLHHVHDKYSIGDALDEWYSLVFSDGDSKRQRAMVSAISRQGRPDIARRVASCGNAGFACERPRLCPNCESRPGGYLQRKYGDRARSWPSSSFMALHMGEGYNDPVEARDDVLTAFSKLKRRRLPINKNWIQQVRSSRFADHLRRLRGDSRSVPFREVASEGVAGVHIKEFSNWFSVHVDVFTNSHFIPFDILDDVWSNCGGSAAKVRRRRTPDGMTPDESIDATLAYVTESVDITSKDARARYAIETMGTKNWVEWGMRDCR